MYWAFIYWFNGKQFINYKFEIKIKSYVATVDFGDGR